MTVHFGHTSRRDFLTSSLPAVFWSPLLLKSGTLFDVFQLSSANVSDPKIIKATLAASAIGPAYLPKQADVGDTGIVIATIPQRDTRVLEEQNVIEALLGGIFKLANTQPANWIVEQTSDSSKPDELVKTTYKPSIKISGYNSVVLTTFHEPKSQILKRSVLTIKDYKNGKKENNTFKIETGSHTKTALDYLNNIDGQIYVYVNDSEKSVKIQINKPDDYNKLV